MRDSSATSSQQIDERKAARAVETAAAAATPQTSAGTGSHFELVSSRIPGCYEIRVNVFTDLRGMFVKTYHEDDFRRLGLETCFVEEYWTSSRHGVLRGLHFQLPPAAHTKLVYCTDGEVMDVVVDLRIGSPTYGQWQRFDLSAAKGSMVYIPVGLAHGFYVQGSSATLVYKVSSIYSSQHDTGILWNSVAIDWPSATPTMSQRDRSFVSFADFQSPFRFSQDK